MSGSLINVVSSLNYQINLKKYTIYENNLDVIKYKGKFIIENINTFIFFYLDTNPTSIIQSQLSRLNAITFPCDRILRASDRFGIPQIDLFRVCDSNRFRMLIASVNNYCLHMIILLYTRGNFLRINDRWPRTGKATTKNDNDQNGKVVDSILYLINAKVEYNIWRLANFVEKII